MTTHNDLQEKFPFLTGLEFNGTEYVGIVQNRDVQIISFYDIEKCRNNDERKLISHCLRTFMNKETEILFGPVTSMQNILKKRIKRRSIQLVKKIPNE